jgi:hypothetical protein
VWEGCSFPHIEVKEALNQLILTLPDETRRLRIKITTIMERGIDGIG